MNTKLRKISILLVFILCVSCFCFGYFIALSKQKNIIGDKALGNFMMVFSAFKYIEKGDDENAKKMLLMSLEGNVVDIGKYGISEIDARYSDRKKKLMLQFADTRKRNSPIEYGDGGIFNHQVDMALQEMTDTK